MNATPKIEKIHGHVFCFILSGEKIFLKKEQNHKFLNKSARSNGKLAKFSKNDLLYDIN